MTNLPAERADVALALTGTQASLFDDDPSRLLGLDDGEFASLVADVRQTSDSVFTHIRKVVGLLAWAAWHRYDEKRYREFVADFAQRLGVESRVILDWRRKAAKGLPMPAMAQARSDARKGAGQTPGNTSGRIIPAASTEAPAKQSEGVGQQAASEKDPARKSAATSGVATEPTPSDPSSGGAGIQPTPTGPTDEHDSSLPAPPDPFDPEEIIERDFGGTVLRGPRKYIDECRLIPLGDGTLAEQVDVDAIGLRWLKSKTTREVRAIGDPWGPAIRSEVRRWAEAFGSPPAPAEKPQRRQGTITRPAVGRPKVVDLMEALEDSLAAAKKPAGKRHADDCSCLSCKAPKAAAK